MATIRLTTLDLNSNEWTEISTDWHPPQFIHHSAAVGILYADGPIKRAYRVVSNGVEVNEPFQFVHTFHVEGWTHAVVERLDLTQQPIGAGQTGINVDPIEQTKVESAAKSNEAKADAQAEAEALDLGGAK